MRNRVRNGGTIGMLGGMDPLVLAEFVRAPYERARGGREAVTAAQARLVEMMFERGAPATAAALRTAADGHD